LNSGGLKQSDYQILPLVEVPNILTAMIAGQVDAGVVSPPTNSRARKAGFNELLNLAKDGPEFVSVAVGASRSYIKANEDTVRRVVRSYAEGVQLFRNNKASALRMIQKYLRVKEIEIAEDTYNQFRENLEYPPYVTRRSLENVIADVAVADPAAKNAKPDDFMDMRFVAELDKQGFFKGGSGK
jgi:ABC-type nitrate/sulfonate/bicarbonate transport system substrate-binding protein